MKWSNLICTCKRIPKKKKVKGSPKTIQNIEDKENEIPKDINVNEELEDKIPEISTPEIEDEDIVKITPVEIEDESIVKITPIEIEDIDFVHEPPPLNYNDDNCYMNSIMQALGSCQKLREDLKELAKEYHSEKLRLFINLLDALNSGYAQDAFDNFMGQYGWNKDGQQDSYEMMAFLINSIYNELKEEEAKKFTDLNKRMFNNLWKEKPLPCRLKMYSKANCGCENNNKSIMNDLSLHLPLVNNGGIFYKFKDMFEAVFNEEPIEDGCEKCKMEKTLRLEVDGNLPRTLCFHIQANKYDENTEMLVKPKYHMDFPFHLELKSKNFEIVSFVVHIGGISSGHYISYRKCKGKWFQVDDQHVDLLTEPNESTDLSAMPYVLFYEMCD